MTPAQFVQNWLLGVGVTITNATYNGSSAIINSNQPGLFIATGNALTQMGLDSGMILTSGKASLAIGPNNECETDDNVNGPGDPDLTILAGVSTFDKCVLEFDFIPFADTVRFKYVFGSEEFFEWCNLFNDPFGFFLQRARHYRYLFEFEHGHCTDAQFTELCYDRQCLCRPLLAMVQCTCHMRSFSSMCVNIPPNGGMYYQYNAMTYVFTAWHTVQPCSTYHIKIAIADALDHIWDSGVFLKKGSFSSFSISVTGPTQVCMNSTGNVYSTQPGMLNYQWTVSPGGTITSGGTSTDNTVTVTWNVAGPQTVTVNYNNGNGCNSPEPAHVNVSVLPDPVPVITGSSMVCLNSGGNLYSTQPGMSNYIWTVSSGGTITGGGTPVCDSVIVTWNASGIQTVSVNYTDTSGCSGENPAIDSVIVMPLPVPGLTGPVTPCAGSDTNVYVTEANMSDYLWSVSSGGTILAGGSLWDNSVTVQWSIPGTQNVSVLYTDTYGCTPVNPTQLIVTVDSLPVPTIEGQDTLCVLSAGNIYTTQQGMNNYNWNVSPGGVITNGAGTYAVTVTWNGSGQQNINVIYADSNGCTVASPAYFYVTVNPLPDSAQNITGPSPICSGTNGLVYSVPEISNANDYLWSLPLGFLIVSGSGSHVIVVDVEEDAVSGIITVNGHNQCGNGPVSSPFPVEVNPHASADAGPEQFTCSGMPVTISQASATNYSSILWLTD